MPATTEICTLALKAGSDVEDRNGSAAKALNECCDTIVGQEGLQKLWLGKGHENPKTLQLFLGECSAAISRLCHCKRI